MRTFSKLIALLFGLTFYLSAFPNVIAPAEDSKGSSKDELFSSKGRNVMAELEASESRGVVHLVKRNQMKRSGRGLTLDKPFLADKESIVSNANENKKSVFEKESEEESKGKRKRGKLQGRKAIKKAGKKSKIERREEPGKKTAKKEGKRLGKHAGKKEGKAPGKKGAKKAKKEPGEKAHKKAEKRTSKKEPETFPAVSTTPIKHLSTFEGQLEVHDKTVKKLSHIEEGYWLITDEVLEKIRNDLMVIINMTKSGDVIAFTASETIQPATTLTIQHELTFTAAHPPKSAGPSQDSKQVLTCPDSGPLLINKAPMFIFINLRVVDCEAPGETATIIIKSGSAASFKYDSFLSNTLRVFYVEPNAKLDVFHCQFKNNTVYVIDREDTGDGGAVKCIGPGAKIKFKNCKVYGSSVEGSGGAIEATNSCTVVIENCAFHGNEAAKYGGAIYAVNSTLLKISSSLFEGNEAENGGGVYMLDRCHANIEYCKFSENTADKIGGAIAATKHSIVNTTWIQVLNNQAKNGGGIHLVSIALDFSDSEVIGNMALESGHSIKAVESRILFDKKTMIEGDTTIEGDIRNVQIQPIPVEAPISAEAPISGKELSSAEAPGSEDEDISLDDDISEEDVSAEPPSSAEALISAEEPISAEAPSSEDEDISLEEDISEEDISAEAPGSEDEDISVEEDIPVKKGSAYNGEISQTQRSVEVYIRKL